MQNTDCGPGSTLHNTERLRDFLAKCISDYEIKTVNDVGCGDLFWISHVDIPDYRGYDETIREKAKERIKDGWGLVRLDVTKDPMRQCDLTVCKDVLRHHDISNVNAIINNIKNASRYLLSDYDQETHIVKQWHKTIDDGNAYCLSANKLNLCDYLGEPLESIESDELKTKRFGIWGFMSGDY